MTRRALLACPLMLAVALGGCFGEPFDPVEPGDVMLLEVASGFDKPLAAVEAGDVLYVVEQTGRIWRVEDGQRDAAPYLDLRARVDSSGLEQGLLGLAFHPDFPQVGELFVAYTALGGGALVLERHTVAASGAAPDLLLSEEVLRIRQPYSNHNGGHVTFGPDGMLYLGVGDGGSARDPHGHGQDPSTLLGTLLRLDVDDRPYTIPEDNPFAPGMPGEGDGASEVWAYGLRNPWRFSFDDGDLWIADVGQGCREEVDRAPAGQGGLNYGWDRYEGGLHLGTLGCGDPATQADGFVWPVHTYVNGGGHCSITGGHVYQGDELSYLQGTYIFGDWCSGVVWGLHEDGEVKELLRTGFRISSFGAAADGGVYLVDHGGAVHMLAPAA